MISVVLFDDKTGRFKGRLVCPEDVIDKVGSYLTPGKEITEQEWFLQPERWWKVDIASRMLIDLNDDELRLVQMIKPDAPLPTRPDMKARGR